MGDKDSTFEDEENTFDDDDFDQDEEEELADAGYFVENEDGFEESKKNLDLDGEEEYGLEPAGGKSGLIGGLLDEYPEEIDDENEEGEEDA